MLNKKSKISLLIITTVLILDQLTKIMVKTHMIEGQEFMVLGSWFRVHFIENNGMAFSMELPTIYGKLFLSLFRIGAIGFITYLLRKIIREGYHAGLVYCGAMILAGAIGNMIDCACYGLIFSDSMGRVAEVFPAGGGYAPFLRGNVVDMLWFPVIHGFFPDWLPIWGGEYFEFFRPIFNIADAAISTGVIIVFVFQKSFFSHDADTLQVSYTDPQQLNDTSA
jgi:signal peptidase II